ncbi:MAG: DUF3883 domain-containing protein [Oleiphilaceae bacterium]|nr:DUF3883 domain-containing protein [Oleiphilaceae bacterium]
MSLLNYEKRFSRLRVNNAAGQKSPHKVAMLLAVIDLIESGHIPDNRLYFNEALRAQFTQRFNSLAVSGDRNNPHLPFFHLRSEGFWHHKIKPGKQAAYNALDRATSAGVIDQHIAYAYLDDELFELLSNQIVRELLRSALMNNLTEQHIQDILQSGQGWDWLECEFIVHDYLDMLNKQLRGERYSKAEHRRALQPRLNNRSEGSIEYKHQNISAVLLELGMAYIPGYKPAFNYQQQLKQVVLSHIAAHPTDWDYLAESGEKEVEPAEKGNINWADVLDTELPERIPSIPKPPRQYLGRILNFSERERRNRQLGESGESFVIEFERYRLANSGRKDLANEVEWRSKTQGDGLGYDIRSFDPSQDTELFLEVKTTNSGKYQPFFLSENERAFSNDFAEDYRLYRVYELMSHPRLFILPGAVEQHVQLMAQQYQASFRGG